MNPLGMLDSLSITGGAAAPSGVYGAPTYLTMNSPFSVAGAGGRANSSASAAGDNTSMMVIALIVGAVLLVVVK